MYTILSEEKVKARKRHMCDLCGEEIEQKEEYIKKSLAGEGTISTWKSHVRCERIVDEIIRSGFVRGEDGVTYEMFEESVEELYGIYSVSKKKEVPMEEKVSFLGKLFESFTLKQIKSKWGYDVILEERS